MTENTNTNPETNLQIALDTNTIFKFECNVEEEKIRLALKQINNDTPNYYETIFTLEELCEIFGGFRACNSLEEVQGHLLTLFKMGNTSLKGFEDDKKIEMDFKFWNINQLNIVSFYLKEISRKN